MPGRSRRRRQRRQPRPAAPPAPSSEGFRAVAAAVQRAGGAGARRRRGAAVAGPPRHQHAGDGRARGAAPLRETTRRCRAAVVMVTARTDSDDVVEALEPRRQRLRDQAASTSRWCARVQRHLRVRAAAAPRRAPTRPGPCRGRPGSCSAGRYRARGAHRRRHLRHRVPRPARRARPAGRGEGAARPAPARNPDALARFRQGGHHRLPRPPSERGRGARLRRDAGRRRVPRDGAARGALAGRRAGAAARSRGAHRCG